MVYKPLLLGLMTILYFFLESWEFFSTRLHIRDEHDLDLGGCRLSWDFRFGDSSRVFLAWQVDNGPAGEGFVEWMLCIIHRENGGISRYTLYSGYLLGISPCKGLPIHSHRHHPNHSHSHNYSTCFESSVYSPSIIHHCLFLHNPLFILHRSCSSSTTIFNHVPLLLSKMEDHHWEIIDEQEALILGRKRLDIFFNFSLRQF